MKVSPVDLNLFLHLIFLTMSEANTTTGQPFPMVDGWPVFNPLAPSAFLPPQIGHPVEISKYILIGTLGVSFSLGRVGERANANQAHVWDILNNIRWDYRLIVKHRVRLQTVVYFISKYVRLFFISVFRTHLPLSQAGCPWIYIIQCNICQ